MHDRRLQTLAAVTEPFLSMVVAPVIPHHERFYKWLNVTITSLLDAHSLPPWLTANAVTYWRTTLVFPTLYWLANGHNVLPAIAILLNDFLDFFDGVVARWWAKRRSAATPRYESGVVLPSRRSKRLAEQWGMYVDAVLDKAFVVPVWVALAMRFGGSLTLTCVLLALAFVETMSAFVRTRAYFAPEASAALPTAHNSAVKSDQVGKTKQTLEMVGSAALLLPGPLSLAGVVLLVAALPLALESVRRKVTPRTVVASIVPSTPGALSCRQIEALHAARSAGTRLIVAVRVGADAGGPDGVAADASVRVVAALPHVDGVVPVERAVDATALRGLGADAVAVLGSGEPGEEPAVAAAADGLGPDVLTTFARVKAVDGLAGLLQRGGE